MEVAAGDDVAVAGRACRLVRDVPFGEDQRVVRRRVHLDREHPPEVVQRVTHRAVDLGSAAQRIGVLHLVRRRVVGALDGAVAEQPAQLRGDLDLARMGPHRLVRRRERDVGPEKRLDRHRRRDARRPEQALRVGRQQGTER